MKGAVQERDERSDPGNTVWATDAQVWRFIGHIFLKCFSRWKHIVFGHVLLNVNLHYDLVYSVFEPPAFLRYIQSGTQQPFDRTLKILTWFSQWSFHLCYFFLHASISDTVASCSDPPAMVWLRWCGIKGMKVHIQRRWVAWMANTRLSLREAAVRVPYETITNLELV